MELKFAILLLLAGMLLFGCAGKNGYAEQKQQASETGVAPAQSGSASGLSESDLALFEESDSTVEISDLPMDGG